VLAKRLPLHDQRPDPQPEALDGVVVHAVRCDCVFSSPKTPPLLPATVPVA
jgi:hypothetical protein